MLLLLLLVMAFEHKFMIHATGDHSCVWSQTIDQSRESHPFACFFMFYVIPLYHQGKFCNKIKRKEVGNFIRFEEGGEIDTCGEIMGREHSRRTIDR